MRFETHSIATGPRQTQMSSLHELYREDTVIQYRRLGERIRGRQSIQVARVAQARSKRFSVCGIIGTAASHHHL